MSTKKANKIIVYLKFITFVLPTQAVQRPQTNEIRGMRELRNHTKKNF